MNERHGANLCNNTNVTLIQTLQIQIKWFIVKSRFIQNEIVNDMQKQRREKTNESRRGESAVIVSGLTITY